MRKLSIEMQSVFGMPPVEHVNLAADLGCECISIGLGPMPWNPCNFLPWSLRDDAALRRSMIAALRDRGITISLAEGFGIRPGMDIKGRAVELDVVAELGARQISAVNMDPDMPRALEQLATLADMSAARGMSLNLEFAPPHPINTLNAALTAIRQINKPNLRLLLDSMHFFRSGATLADLQTLDPSLIGYVQLNDVPLVAPHDNYLKEACFSRMIPGQGELPLREFIAALPKHLVLGLEIPMLAELETADDLRGPLTRAVAAIRNLL